MEAQDITEAVQRAAREAAEEGVRVVVTIHDKDEEWQPDGYGGRLKIRNRDLTVTIGAEPSKVLTSVDADTK